MPPRRRTADQAEVRAALGRVRAAVVARTTPDRSDLRLLVRHYLDALVERAPGRSVEVRVPPYGAVQAIPGRVHTRGTPPAVVETDAATWIALATGDLLWTDAVDTGAVRPSGERSDLSQYLPLA